MAKSVLITGGSSGIGRELVKLFAREGYSTWFTYFRGRDRAEELISSLPQGKIRAFRLDLGHWESHRLLLKELPGPVDVLINNAGLGSKTVESVAQNRHEQDAALLMVNAVGPLWLTRAILPTMLRRNFGKIIFVSSVGGGITHFPDFRTADGMSKAAMAYLGKHLQARHVHDPLDIFTICPGSTATPMFEASTLSLFNETEREHFASQLPGGRLIDPKEIASLALWLCTDEARVLRGSILDASLGLGVAPAAQRRARK
jgi:NAD(P)-dependent dehydrogenase (short-subunit alcohol dehydrogenase family)